MSNEVMELVVDDDDDAEKLVVELMVKLNSGDQWNKVVLVPLSLSLSLSYICLRVTDSVKCLYISIVCICVALYWQLHWSFVSSFG